MQRDILKAVLISMLGYILCRISLPRCAPSLVAANLFGYDLGKRGTKLGEKKVPEAGGAISAISFLFCLITVQSLFASNPTQLILYSAACFSICFIVFLGFFDDVINIRWRNKLLLSPIAAVPLLCAYYYQKGTTTIVVPRFLRSLLCLSNGSFTSLRTLFTYIPFLPDNSQCHLIDIGWLYYLYMLLLGVFCTNAINIYAGVNGLEVGQSIVIGFSICLMNLLEISLGGPVDSMENHHFSLMIGIPFLLTSLALLHFNWYPAQIFVGDTFCYYAGMTFAVMGILGHHSKTTLLFFLPQILNFLISGPQLFGLLPCPRHRLPHYNAAIDCVEPSRIPKEQDPKEHVNLTVLNLVLVATGPVREETLVLILLVLQTASCAMGLLAHFALLR